jgi:hypothetical protein
MERRGKDLSDAEVDHIRSVSWPACYEILRAAMEKMQVEFEMAAHTDDAFSMVTVILLNEVFMRQTILAAAGRLDADDVMDWVEQQYEAWDQVDDGEKAE